MNGNCAGQLDVMIPDTDGMSKTEKGEAARAAKAVCVGCPILDDCLDLAMSADYPVHGVWGGTSERDRRNGQHPAVKASRARTGIYRRTARWVAA